MTNVTIIGQKGWEALYKDTLSFLERYLVYCEQNRGKTSIAEALYITYPTYMGQITLACAMGWKSRLENTGHIEDTSLFDLTLPDVFQKLRTQIPSYITSLPEEMRGFIIEANILYQRCISLNRALILSHTAERRALPKELAALTQPAPL